MKDKSQPQPNQQQPMLESTYDKNQNKQDCCGVEEQSVNRTGTESSNDISLHGKSFSWSLKTLPSVTWRE